MDGGLPSSKEAKEVTEEGRWRWGRWRQQVWELRRQTGCHGRENRAESQPGAGTKPMSEENRAGRSPLPVLTSRVGCLRLGGE